MLRDAALFKQLIMLGKYNHWRIWEPVLLGFFANLFVNIMFNPSDPGSWWSKSEIVMAILFCTIITESNRYIEKRLAVKYDWKTDTWKRFFYQLFGVSLILLFLVNVVGRLYHWMRGDTFYEVGEIVIINLIAFIITLILVLFKWAGHFYREWETSATNLDETQLKVAELSSLLEKNNASIKLQKNNRDYNGQVKDLRLIKSQFGVVKVFMENDDWYVFQGSLTKLDPLLPEHLFFRATRNIIVHRQQILSISSASFGKIQVKIKEPHSDEVAIFVSRLKAAAFRKWYHSSSPIDL